MNKIANLVTLANSLEKLLPILSFANWMESPLGLPKIPRGLGLTEMERLTQEIGIFDGRITSLNTEDGDWGEPESWESILQQSHSKGEECNGIEGIWEWRRNGTKVGNNFEIGKYISFPLDYLQKCAQFGGRK